MNRSHGIRSAHFRLRVEGAARRGPPPRCCFRVRLSHKALAEEPRRARESRCQRSRPRRRHHGLPVRNGPDGPFRNPCLEALQRARFGFVRQPRVVPALAALRGRPDRECCFPMWLLHKAVSENELLGRGDGRQGGRVPRRQDGRASRDGYVGRFRNPPLEAIQRARRGFVQQPRAVAAVSAGA
jgi:hypothetical protein